MSARTRQNRPNPPGRRKSQHPQRFFMNVPGTKFTTSDGKVYKWDAQTGMLRHVGFASKD